MTPFFNTVRLGLVCMSAGLLLNSCQYEELVEATYPQQILYMPAAKGGVFSIAGIPASGAYRFTVKLDEKKIIIPLSVYRGGVSVDGDVPVTVAANPDTISRLIAANTVLANTVALPADQFSLPASVTIPAGATIAPFDLTLNLDYLRANPGKKLAVAVSIASPQTAINPLLRTTVISFDPAILKPTTDFTSKADATTPRKVAFTNTSLNALTYSWDFGDGSATSSDKSPTYTYSKAGTYSVTLTATGITGSVDAVKKTATVTVP